MREMLTNAERLRRLRLLRDATEQYPDGLFDMGEWGRATACGTAACAFGAYVLAHGKEFRLTLGNNWAWSGLAPVNADGLFVTPESHFDLECGESDRVFIPSHYEYDGYDDGRDDGRDIPKAVVLERIDALIREYEAADEPRA